VTASMRIKFTVEQATQTLPLVRRIVEDIVVSVSRWQERVREFDLVSASVTTTTPDPRATELERETTALAAEVDRYVAELTALGIEMKDYAMGLIDFPSERDGRPVYLCWRLGEPSVLYWHEVDAGYSGRHPLDPLIAA
jgi:hypothetical protein